MLQSRPIKPSVCNIMSCMFNHTCHDGCFGSYKCSTQSALCCASFALPSSSASCHPPRDGSVLVATSCPMLGLLCNTKPTTCGDSGLQLGAPCWRPNARWTFLLGAPHRKGAPSRRTTLRARHRRHQAALGILSRHDWRRSAPDWLLRAMSAFKPIDAHLAMTY